MAIHKLPKEVRAAVRSGIAIATISQCVSELVLNSLDAGADSVVIHLDIPRYKLQVVDNGCGITLDNLQHIGIRYNTSKCRSLSDLRNNLKFYGYRGEALASLSECCSFLIIVTRPRNEDPKNTYCKTFAYGKPNQPNKAISKRTSAGTTITIQDFMYNAPVRQKRIKPNVDVEEVRIQVEALALSHPHVSFIIKDERDNSVVLNVPRSSNTLETFRQLYGREIASHLCPIGPFTSGKLSINGFISTTSHYNKRLQFIFVNGRFVKGTKLHKLINMIMRKSNVLRGNGPWQELPMPERVRDFLWISPLKKKDRFCVFLVNISCPLSEYDITLDPKKTLIEFCDWDSLLECMENVVKDFLKKHNLTYVATDPEICDSQSTGGSPSSVLNEMDILDKEDALGQKLSQFRYNNEVFGGHGEGPIGEIQTVNMARAICSIPAKRNLVNMITNSDLKRSDITPENKITKEKIRASNQILNKSLLDNAECSKNTYTISLNHTEITNAKDLTKYSSLTAKNSTVTSSPLSDEHERKTYQFGLNSSVNNSGLGSLGRFRKLFKQAQAFSQQTPDDVMKIKVIKPPPIVRRQAPLEHRIKACMNVKQFKSTSMNTITTFSSSSNKLVMQNKESLISNVLKDFTFDKTFSKNIEKNSDILIGSTCGSSGCIKKIYPTKSTATQTEIDSMLFGGISDVEKRKVSHDMELKANLRNLKRKYFQESLGSHNKIEVYSFDLTKKVSKNTVNVEDNLSNNCLNSNHKLKEYYSHPIQNDPPVEITNKNFLTSEDFLCAMRNDKEAFKNDLNLRSGINVMSNSNVIIIPSEMENNPHTAISDNRVVSDAISMLDPNNSSVTYDHRLSIVDLCESPSRSLQPHNNSSHMKSIILPTHSGCSQIPSQELAIREKVRETLVLHTSGEMLHENSCKEVSDSKGSFEQECKTLEKSDCQKTLTDCELINCIPDSATSFSNGANCEINSIGCRNLVPMYDSDDESSSVSKQERILSKDLKSLPLKSSENNSTTENQDQSKTNVSKRRNESVEKYILNEGESNHETFVESPLDIDQMETIGIEKRRNNYDCFKACRKRTSSVLSSVDKRHCVENSPLISEKNSFSMLKEGGSPECVASDFVAQNTERSLNYPEDVNGKISPKFSQDTNAAEKICSSFDGSNDWDIALVDKCNELENNNAIINDDSLPKSNLGPSNNDKLANKNNDHQKEKRFEMFARQPFLPKGLSPVMPVDTAENKRAGRIEALSPSAENELYLALRQNSLSDELARVKWGHRSNSSSTKETLPEHDKSDENVLSCLLSETENKKRYGESEVISACVNNQTKSFVKIYNLIYPCTFSKEILTNFKMLGKLDCKFIVANISMDNDKISNAIVLFDQHAVHERIRLEKLTQDYQFQSKVDGDYVLKFKSVAAMPAFEISVSSTEARMMESFQKQFERLGLYFERSQRSEHCNDEVMIKITGIPACLSSKDPKELGPLGLKEQIHSLIREQVEDLMVTRGIGTFSPAILRDAINMEACRGAVKFGDCLSNRECRWLLRKLSTCDTPFQCAHGRPSMFPVADLRHLGKYCNDSEQESKPCLWKLRKLMK